MPLSKRVHLSSKGQLVVPQEMRERLGLRAGDELVLYLLSDRVLVAEVMEPSPLEQVMVRLEQEANQRGLTRADVGRALEEVRQESYRERKAG